MTWTWDQPSYVVFGVWIGIAATVLFLWLDLRGRARINRFVSRVMYRRLAQATPTWALVIRAIAIGATIVFTGLSLARLTVPSETETEEETVTADVAFVLDVSRSMLAADAAPNRLTRAKAGIFNIIGQLRDSRIALITFAGEASMQSALTSNHDYFRIALRTAGPQSSGRGGTDLFAAIKAGVEALDTSRRTKIMVLITDGENHENEPLAAVDLAKEAKVHVITVGFGSEEGSPIMVVDPKTQAKVQVSDRDGNPVISKLDGALLRQIAEKTEGAYIPAGTSAVQMDAIVEDHIKPLLATQMVTRTRDRVDLSMAFVFLACVMFAIAAMMPVFARRISL